MSTRKNLAIRTKLGWPFRFNSGGFSSPFSQPLVSFGRTIEPGDPAIPLPIAREIHGLASFYRQRRSQLTAPHPDAPTDTDRSPAA
jgi:hypothetical protein